MYVTIFESGDLSRANRAGEYRGKENLVTYTTKILASDKIVRQSVRPPHHFRGCERHVMVN